MDHTKRQPRKMGWRFAFLAAILAHRDAVAVSDHLDEVVGGEAHPLHEGRVEQVRGRAVVVVNPTTRRIEVYRYG